MNKEELVINHINAHLDSLGINPQKNIEDCQELAINISESKFNSSIKFLMDKGFSINNSLPLTVIFIIKSILWLIIKVKKSRKNISIRK